METNAGSKPAANDGTPCIKKPSLVTADSTAVIEPTLSTARSHHQPGKLSALSNLQLGVQVSI